jgi:hypothetical protein
MEKEIPQQNKKMQQATSPATSLLDTSQSTFVALFPK